MILKNSVYDKIKRRVFFNFYDIQIIIYYFEICQVSFDYYRKVIFDQCIVYYMVDYFGFLKYQIFDFFLYGILKGMIM